MPIPAFGQNGLLPDGVHDCTLEEVAERFGSFQGSDQRPRLWARFAEFVREAKACGLVEAVIVNGSFVTAEPHPNDIDLVLVVGPGRDYSADLQPGQYNVLSKWRVRRRFGFDIILARSGTEEVATRWIFSDKSGWSPICGRAC